MSARAAMTQHDRQQNLREACLQEAMRIIETDGIEQLSMREVSRRLGISHQAPYKHFASRDHILAEILARCFEDFARHLEARPRSEDPHADLLAMGHAYLTYAAQHPLQYRLMFGMPLPDAAQHPQMMEKAGQAFNLLREAISRMGERASLDSDALFVWATMHGLAGILRMQLYQHLSVASHTDEQIIQAVLHRIGTGLGEGG
jgi:AcrR family transcriptional regulator